MNTIQQEQSELKECRAGDAERPFCTVAPCHHVRSDEHGIDLEVLLPGVRREDVTLRVERQGLVIEASRAFPVPSDWQLVAGHAEPVCYRLRLALAPQLNGDAAAARLADGVLSVRVPLRDEAKPRQIAIG